MKMFYPVLLLLICCAWSSLAEIQKRQVPALLSECLPGLAPIGIENKGGVLRVICGPSCFLYSPERAVCSKNLKSTCSYAAHEWVGGLEIGVQEPGLKCCTYSKVHKWLTTSGKTLADGETINGKTDEKNGHKYQEVLTDVSYLVDKEYDVIFARIECDDIPPPDFDGAAAAGPAAGLSAALASIFSIPFEGGGSSSGGSFAFANDAIVVGSGAGAGAGACFTGDSEVLTPHGPTTMDSLRVGDLIATETDPGVVGYSPVKYFLHREPETPAIFVRVETAGGKSLSLTPNHVLFVTSCDLKSANQRSAVTADSLKVNMCLISHTEENKLVADKVSKISRFEENGIYAPVTETGTLLVGDVLASCYIEGADTKLNRALLRTLDSVQRMLQKLIRVNLVDDSEKFVPITSTLGYILDHMLDIIPTSILA